MKLKSFQVTKFRNIVDSGNVDIDESVTCLVGKNEAGKSGLLEALYLFNPAYEDSFNVDEQYPRWLVVRDRRRSDLSEVTPISVVFELDTDELAEVNDYFNNAALLDGEVKIRRKYSGGMIWTLNWSEKNAIQGVKSKFSESVQDMLSTTSSLDDLSERLKALQPDEDDEEGGLTVADIDKAKKIIAEDDLETKGVWQLIVNFLKPHLPKFFRFTSYNTLPGRIDFKDLSNNANEGRASSGLQAAKALLELAGTDVSQLGHDDYELRRGELEAVQIDLTNQVFEYWKQNPDLEVIIDVDRETIITGHNRTAVSRFLDIRLRDRRTGYSNNFSQRSSGFQWFFSFLAAFSEFEDDESTVVLLDEPALNLHGRAQADFLRFINERLAPNAPVLYTTHSPFMVEADKLERVRIVEDKGPPEGSVANKDILGSDPDTLFPLQAALGYDIAQNLFVGPHNLIVEGTSDFIYLTIMSSLCKTHGKEHLDDRWRTLPVGGATNIPTFVSLIGPHLDVTVLADSDTKGMQRITNMIDRTLLKRHRLIFASDAIVSHKADIEDLFDESEYLAFYNQTFGSDILVTDLPTGDRIVKRIEVHIGQKYDHGKVAETFLRTYQSLTLSELSLNQFEELVKKLNATINT